MKRLDAHLLIRNRTLFLDDYSHYTPHIPPASAEREVPSEKTKDLNAQNEPLRVLEWGLLQLGYLPSRQLYERLNEIGPMGLKILAPELETVIAESLGAYRKHVPLFRKFPEGTPENTEELFIKRLLVYLLQAPEQPCLLCAKEQTVHPLDPCGHLICRACWAGENYSGCPVCNRRINQKDPFIKQGQSRPALSGPPVRDKIKLLFPGRDRDKTAKEIFLRLMERKSPLSTNDRETLNILIEHFGPGLLEIMPKEISLKENMATVFGTLLLTNPHEAGFQKVAREYIKTATDLLRTLVVMMGGDPALREPLVKVKSQPRAIRRFCLERLGSFPVESLIEDLKRYPGLWKRIGHSLHVFEKHKRYPTVALAFSIIRRSSVMKAENLVRSLSPVLERMDKLRYVGARIEYNSWSANVESALAAGNLKLVLKLLSERPGEFLRRLDLSLRRVNAERPELLEELQSVFENSILRSPAPLLVTLGAHLRSRRARWSRRLFFPRSEVAPTYASDDHRPVLSSELTAPYIEKIHRVLLSRAEALAGFEESVLDISLKNLPTPFNERSSAKALVSIPRGGELAMPPGNKMRLFLHWMEEPAQSVDLDLSVAFFDQNWRFVSLCDYTRLRFKRDVAVHSGDLTSAPPPLGASEFIDLDINRMAKEGVAYFLFVVFSYNGVPFENMRLAFAGMMEHHGQAGEVFEAQKVEQRFDLQGNALVCIPLLGDLENRRMRWVDINMPAEGVFHSVLEHRGLLANLGRDFEEFFRTGSRPSLWELACIHAAARTRRVRVRLDVINGEDEQGMVLLERKREESVYDFFVRLLWFGDDVSADADVVELAPRPALYFLKRDDLPAAPGSVAYVLNHKKFNTEEIRILQASDFLSALK